VYQGYGGKAQLPWTAIRTSNGRIYRDWIKPVPRIPDVLLNSIVYLYDDELNAETGVDFGGSGFLVGMTSEVGDGSIHYYVITNTHVIEHGFPVVRINLLHSSSGLTRTEVFPFTKESWVTHPNHDLAVRAMPADLNSSLLAYMLLPLECFITREEFREKNIGAGDDLVYIGRFMGHAGKHENLPSVRFGNISMVPNEREPISYTINGKQREQVGYLVEARSRSGYSGSPVFFLHRHAANNSRLVMLQFDLRLLGVDWGHIPEEVPIVDKSGHLHGDQWKIEVHAGMMGVVPSWYLLDFLKESPELIEQRRRDDEYYRSHPPIGVPEV
jgi:hypothetical protein